jgi:truncated hemoglobin YjbI
MTEPTMFEYAGGAPALRALAETHYEACVTDPVLAEVFGAEAHPEHVAHLADWLGEVLGGPDRYTRLHGGHHALLLRHAGRGIAEDQRRRFVEVFLESADAVGLPANPVFRERLREYLEWGTAIARDVSQSPTVAETHEPVPIWGWGPAGAPAD